MGVVTFLENHPGAAPTGGINFRQSVSEPPAVDIAQIELLGFTVSRTLRMMLFTTNKNAVRAADEALRRLSYPFARVQFKANRSAFRLQPGDPFKFSCQQYTISSMVCRVDRVEEEGPEDESITVYATQEPSDVVQLVTDYEEPPDYRIGKPSRAPGSIEAGKIIELPHAICGDVVKIVPLAAKSSALAIGFLLYMSIDAGVSYTCIARCPWFSHHGTLKAQYSGGVPTIDDNVGFQLDAVSGLSLLNTVSFDTMLGGGTLALLGDELIGFQTVTPQGSGVYEFTGVGRGRLDTLKQTHAVDTEFWYLGSGYQAYAHSNIQPGADLYFKMVPYTTAYAGTLADATAINYTVTGRALTPYIPINLRANGNGQRPTFTGDIVLTWDPRVRGGQGAGVGLPSQVTDDTKTWEGYFEIEFWLDDVLKRTQDGINAITYTYTQATHQSDNGGALADEVVVKLRNYRSSGGATYESDQATLTIKKE